MATETTLYRLYTEDRCLLYVGIATVPLERLASHQRERPWWPMVRRIDLTVYPTRREAFDAESEAIRTERPLFNIAQNAYAPQSGVMPRHECVCGTSVPVTSAGKLRAHYGRGGFCGKTGTTPADYRPVAA